MAENKKTTAARTTNWPTIDRPSTLNAPQRTKPEPPPPPLHRQHHWHPFPSLASPHMLLLSIQERQPSLGSRMAASLFRLRSYQAPLPGGPLFFESRHHNLLLSGVMRSASVTSAYNEISTQQSTPRWGK
jgi:hypothetical protein